MTQNRTQATANWDIAVVDENGDVIPDAGGRLHAVQWNLELGGRNQANALSHSFFALVDG